MATKIIQDTQIPRLAPSVGIAATTVPIALKTGYLRITIGSTTSSSGGYIAIGTNPIATQDNYHVTSYSVDIIKEPMKRQSIAGITTGTTTRLIFDNNAANPFSITDFVTIENAPTIGLNTSHIPIVSLNDSSITINFNSSSITSPNISGATVAKSVKVSCLTYEPDTFFNIAEVVTLVSE
jgi:hypothetical protein